MKGRNIKKKKYWIADIYQNRAAHGFYHAILALTLRFLASGHSMTSLSYQYLLGITTVSNIIHETYQVIWNVLCPINIQCSSHLAEECILHGYLEQFSTFEYENGKKDTKKAKGIKSNIVKHYNLPYHRSYIDGPAPFIKNCGECQQQRLRSFKSCDKHTSIRIAYIRISIYLKCI
ncbi:hypothetical protein ALC60_11721 [Trachymyrmex zeteki]|uniref:Uncharacterized protein n=1 Tax=Mycetomoellerius zeteki TaxID=64791 RepID=A0A151WNF4_9HYME|nr:hypothetical protein ALC60_11721 [Trachymyrmex zeteki]